METQSIADELPALYRAVLDAVAELEQRGERREAEQTRSEAIRIYSRSWDAGARRRLEAVLRRARRTVAAAGPAH